jgi:hypothetical protein
LGLLIPYFLLLQAVHGTLFLGIKRREVVEDQRLYACNDLKLVAQDLNQNLRLHLQGVSGIFLLQKLHLTLNDRLKGVECLWRDYADVIVRVILVIGIEVRDKVVNVNYLRDA